jgi:hypothetical protein
MYGPPSGNFPLASSLGRGAARGVSPVSFSGQEIV